MKYILMTVAFATAASFSQAADPPAETRADVQRIPEAPAPLGPFVENVEVLAADPSGKQVTLKIEGQEVTLPVPATLAPTMRVVRAGDKVRVHYQETDAQGLPRKVESLLITKPNSEVDLEALRKKPGNDAAGEDTRSGATRGEDSGQK